MIRLGYLVFVLSSLILLGAICSPGHGDDDDLAADDDTISDDDSALPDDDLNDDADDDINDDVDDDLDDDDDDDVDDDSDDDSDDDADDDVDDDADDDSDDDVTDDDTTDDDSIDDDTVDDDSADDDTIAPAICNLDADRDGHGVPGFNQEVIGTCPIGWSDTTDDCDDTDILTWTGAPELPDDAIDQNCDGGDLVMSDATGVFVAKSGNDSNPGTMVSPKLTIKAGVAQAETDGKAVFIAAGTYEECFTTHVSIFGGYESAGWTRDPDLYPVTIDADSTAAGPAATVKAAGTSPLALQALTINGGDQPSDTVGLYSTAGVLVIVNSSIFGGYPSSNQYYTSYSTGVDIDAGEAFLVRDAINGGGAGSAHYVGSCGVATADDVTLRMVDNTVDGGSAIGSDGNCGTTGVASAGVAILWNNTIFGGHSTCASNVSNAGLMVGAGSEFVSNIIDGGHASASSVNYSGSSTGAILYYMSYSSSPDVVFFNNRITGGESDGGYPPSFSAGIHLFNWHNGQLLFVNNLIDGGKHSGSYTATYGIQGTWQSDWVTAINNVLRAGTPSGSQSSGVCASVGGLFVNNLFIGPDNGAGTGIDFSNESMATLANNNFWLVDNCLAEAHLPYENFCITDIDELNACEWYFCTDALGNLNVDPQFADAANGDYHLSEGSLCIDAGVDPEPWYDGDLADFDFEGDPRPSGAGWDIGADEFVSN